MPAPEQVDSSHGLTGINPKRGVSPREFALYAVDRDGSGEKLVGIGTAGQLANRFGVGASMIYKLAGKAPRKGGKWRVERVSAERVG